MCINPQNPGIKPGNTTIHKEIVSYNPGTWFFNMRQATSKKEKKAALAAAKALQLSEAAATKRWTGLN